MGLFGRRRREGVRGTARVVSLNHAPHATHGSLRMTVVVEAPGVPAFTHVYKKFGARVDKWPDPGDVLPVELDPADPSEVDVLWDELPTARDAAARQAEELAAQLRQQQAAPGGYAPGGPGGYAPGGYAAGGHPPEGSPAGADVAGLGDMVDQLQRMFPGAEINVGTDPAGSPAAPPAGQPAGSPPPGGGPGFPPGDVNVVASRSDGDPVERLEKLARLRDAGVVDQAQFEQLRAQILGQAGLEGA